MAPVQSRRVSTERGGISRGIMREGTPRWSGEVLAHRTAAIHNSCISIHHHNM
jgi:hypothetical protein